MRWGEVVGLETEYLRGERLRVEWQLYELETGELHRCPPKDGSRRWIDLPEWPAALMERFGGPGPACAMVVPTCSAGMGPLGGRIVNREPSSLMSPAGRVSRLELPQPS